MAEVQKTTVSAGEVTLRFIEFVRMHSHNASLCLGKAPQGGKAMVNLPLAKLLIDQLLAIEMKTRGNLNGDEHAVITSALETLQNDYAAAIGRK